MSLSIDLTFWQAFFMALDYAIKAVAIGIVPEGRRPSSSNAWLLTILLLPFVGLPLFLLMGSPYINRRRHRIQQEANEMIDDITAATPDHPEDRLPAEVESLIHLNRELTGFPCLVGHNQGLHADYAECIRAIARAIDAAEEYVYVEIYIQSWDEATDVFYQSLARARQRGVEVKLLLDQIGSIKYPGYFSFGKKLNAIDVDWRLMLPIQLHKFRFRRPDLRNHRKIVVIDGHTGFLGSLNMIKRQYKTEDRAWIDYMVELTGPVVTSLAAVFAVDWYLESNETLGLKELPYDDAWDADANFLQLIPSGPGYTTEPNLRMFNSVVHHAKERLVMVSPYFVPDESLMEAVTTACYRGVRVELYVSAKADQFMVNHAQSSYYQTLLEAGVHIYQFPEPYVLHSKFTLADPDEPANTSTYPLAMFGSSNMDMRSFGLNYESTMLVARGDLIDQLNQLAANYRSVSHELTLEEWNTRGFFRRYVDNVMRLTSALQ
ncbi:phospholipase D-like domain-containing protein [Corynebacterium sp. HMSC04H06]|uniref:phospholipase D-like domain-containing protein n=1 Tax=Corynebacterium sp. HMSC04H06 TaxID=1581050 RepID=UPI0008A1C506|nr:phospholipase D-like domain-containing protein [Corynebacterium sp. HMSC04H06]OFS21979.1 cardiolipin synthase A [Corynebacterium sp. HMSC04H06]